MTNCSFTQPSTYYGLQQELTKALLTYKGTAEDVMEFIVDHTAKFISLNLQDEFTDEVVTYAALSVANLLSIINNPAISKRFPGTVTSGKAKLPSAKEGTAFKKAVTSKFSDMQVVNNGSTDVPPADPIPTLTEGEPEKTLEQESTMGSNSGFNDVINLDTTITNVGDITKMFVGAINAQNRLDKILSSNILNKFMVYQDLNTGKKRYNVNDMEVDNAVKAYKEDLYKKLVTYYNKQTKSNLSTSYYGTNNFIHESVNENLQKIKSYYVGLNLRASQIEAWEKSNIEALDNYLNYIILSNFDHLFSISGKGIYKVASATFNNSLETKNIIKYRMALSETISGGFSEEYDLLGEQTSIFKRFVSAVPHVKRDGTISLVNKWDNSSVNGIVARLFQDVRDRNRDKITYRKDDPLHSMIDVFEFFLENHFGKVINDFKKSKIYTKGEQEIILSIYLTFFTNENSDLNKILGKDLAQKVSNFKNDALYTLDANTHNYTLNPVFTPVNIIMSNFNKTYFNTYTQITYNPESKGIMFETLDAKTYESDVIFLKNTINGFINLPTNKSAFGEISVDANSGVVTVNLPNSKNVIINLVTGKVEYTVNGITQPSVRDLAKNSTFLSLANKLLKIPVDNEDLLGSISIELDKSDSYQTGFENTITTLSRLVGAAATIKEIIKQRKANRPTYINNNSYLKSRNLYNADLGLYLIQNVYANANNDIEGIARAFTSINGTLYKAVTKTLNKKTMPLHAEARHLYVIPELLDYLGEKNQYSTSYPLKNNLFVANRHLLRSPVIRTYVKIGDNVKHSSEFSPAEFMITSIGYEFLGSLNSSKNAKDNSNMVYIQPTVFTDKNMHYLLPINIKEKVRFRGIDRTFNSLSKDELGELMFYLNNSYYSNLAIRMLEAYIPVVRALVMDDISILEQLPPLQALIELDKFMAKIPNLSVFKNKFFEIHGDRIPLMDELGFRKGKVVGLSASLIEYAKIFDNPNSFGEFLERSKQYFIRDLEDMNFKLEYKSTFGTITPIFNGLFDATQHIITQAEFEEKWVDQQTGYIKISIEGPNKVKQLNPLLENYFLMDNIVSDAFQQASMGTIHNHASKGEGSIPSNATPTERADHIISLKTKTSYKRQLAGTPGKPINQGIINGSTNEIKVVSVTDVSNPTFNPYGLVDAMTTSDGAKLTPMLQIILQNNSLQDNKAGLTQKILSNTLDPYYMGLDQDKSAEHPLTNEVIRNSVGNKYNLKILVKKAMNIPFAETAGQNVNIMRDYNGNVLTVDTIAPDGIFYAQWNDVAGRYEVMQVTDIVSPTTGFYNPDGNYTVTIKNLFTNQVEVRPVPINSLYDLWEILGAERSVSPNENGNIKMVSGSFLFSDASNYTLANFVNAVGTWTTKTNLKVIGKSEKELVNKGKRILKDMNTTSRVPTQKEIWQPLKESFIHTYAFISGEKSGARSTQNVESVFADDDVRPLAFSQTLLSAFLLLNSEHEADQSELSEMSQIVSALVFNYETPEHAQRAYKAISNLMEVKLRRFVDGIAEFEKFGNKDKLYKYVVKILINSFTDRDQKTIAGLLANMANTEEVSEADIEGVKNQSIDNMPFSSYIYKQFNAMLASTFTKDIIKRKFSGLAGPIKSSASYIQVYDVKDSEGNIRTVTSEKFRTKYKGQVTNELVTDVDDVALFDHVLVDGKELYIDTVGKLFTFRNRGLNNKTTVKKFTRAEVAASDAVYLFGDNVEDATTGYVPSSTQAVIRGLPNAIGISTKKNRGTTAESYLTDADYDWFVAHVDAQIDKAVATGKTIVVPEDGIGTGKAFLEVKAPKLYEYLVNKLSLIGTTYKLYGKPRELKPEEVKFTVHMPDGTTKANYSIFYTMETRIAFGLMDLIKGNLTKEAQFCLTDPSIQTLLQTVLGDHVPTVDFYKKNAGAVERIAKKLVQDTYKKLVNKRLVNIDGVDYPISNIVTISGEAMGPNINVSHFGLDHGISVDDVTEDTFYQSLKKKTAAKVQGAQRYVLNADGQHIYVFSDEEYRAQEARFRDANERVRTIDDISYLVDEQDELQYNIDGVIYKKYLYNGQILDAVVFTTPESLLEFYENNNLKLNQDIFSTDSKSQEAMDRRNKEQARRMYSSFKLSLEYTAARIPGQGPQSFSPLKIVEFLNEENTVLTNHFTTWLKGEDYDIDKSFWLGNHINKQGILTGWSRLFDYSSADQLRLSLELPVPRGKVPTNPEGIRLTEDEHAVLVGPLTRAKVDLLNAIEDFGLAIPTEEEFQALSPEVQAAYNAITEFFSENNAEGLSDRALKNLESKLEYGYKNVIARNMYNMIAHPLNRVHAGSPVTFKELNTFKESIVPKVLSPNSPATKAIIQDANMVGKKVVGIAAVGLKVWSAVTYWANGKKNDNKFHDIILDKKYYINGKVYNILTVANINFDNGLSFDQVADKISAALIAKRNTMDDQEIMNINQFVYDYSLSLGLSEDQSLVISAILSAATDNAKELILQEVNGGQLTAGIYIYLSMLGIDLMDIIHFMNSPAIKTATELARKNIYDESTSRNKLENAIKYIMGGPNIFKEPRYSGLNARHMLDNIRTALVKLNKFSDEEINFIWNNNPEEGFSAKYENFVRLTKGGPKEILALIKEIKDTVEDYYTFESNNDDVMGDDRSVYVGIALHRYLDRMTEYITKYLPLLDDPNLETFTQVIDEANEVAVLGRILGANQGIRTEAYGQYSYLLEYDEMIKARMNGEEFSLFDVAAVSADAANEIRQRGLGDFIPEYIEVLMKDFKFEWYIKEINKKPEENPNTNLIEIYKVIGKHFSRIFNILDIVDYVPHYKKIMHTVSVMEEAKDALTLRDRTINRLIQQYHQAGIFPSKTNNPAKLTEDQYLKVHRIFNDVLSVVWLRSLPDPKRVLSAKMMEEVILKGNTFVTVEHETPKTVRIDLATTEGRANFVKMFYDLILKLKEDPIYKDNVFIQGLGFDNAEDPISGQTYPFFRLPINLMNISDHNINEFSAYVTAFNELNAQLFGTDPSKNEANTIKDLFFIYNLLVHRDAANKSSFTKLFEKSTSAQESSLMKDYIKKVAELDFSDAVLQNALNTKVSGGDYTLLDWISRTLSPQIDLNFGEKALKKYLGPFAHALNVEKVGDSKKRSIKFYEWAPNMVDGVDKGSYKVVNYLTDYTAIPMSVDFPSMIELISLRDMERREQMRNTINNLDDFIQDFNITCE